MELIEEKRELIRLKNDIKFQNDLKIIDSVKSRVRNSGYKRSNPYNLLHPMFPARFGELEILDEQL
jgi:hypothetical protein